MNIVLVAEKPSIARLLAFHAQAHWPDATVSVLSLVPYANLRHSYPRGLSWSDYPVISTPRSAKNDWERWSGYSYTLKNGIPVEIKPNHALFMAADEIVFACDPDPTGAVSFHTFMRLIFGDDRAQHCLALNLYDLSPEGLRKAFQNMQLFGVQFARMLDAGITKRYFDWHWNSNALAILQESAEFSGVRPEAFPVSKYGLQLLYALRQKTGPFSDSELVALMQKWPGTGRYPTGRVSLGSPSAYARIIDNLRLTGHLQRDVPFTGNNLLTPQAEAYLAVLHPDCEDPDLPFRLAEWCQAGLEASQPAIDRYIRTYFGKQERHLAKLKRERNARV